MRIQLSAAITTRAARASVRLGVLSGALLVFSFLSAPAASADYSQLPPPEGNFGQSGEGQQLAWATGAAVNVTGVGGVPAGSLYVVGQSRVVRYSATGEFKEAWGWGVSADEPSGEFQRCGPEGEVSHPHCNTNEQGGVATGAEGLGQLSRPAAVAVDQTTGYVYVLNTGRLKQLIQVFTATGLLVTTFGEGVPQFPESGSAKSIDETPDKLHFVSNTTNAIAVDAAGKVYVSDNDWATIATPPGEARVMCFEPEAPGDYEHHVYCGRNRDIKLGPNLFGHETRFVSIALDNANHLYGASLSSVKELSLTTLGAQLCTAAVVSGALKGLTVNAATGEVFYFAAGSDQTVHRLGPCDEASGEFAETQKSFAPAPKTTEMRALAVNPALILGGSPLRPAGVLYGADAENHFSLVPSIDGSGSIFAPAEALEPEIESESVANTSTSSATLRAEIDPRGFTAHFIFEYLPESAYMANGETFEGAAEAPAGGGELDGTGKGIASAAITGLQPDTEYRFRVVAVSKCEGEGGEPCEAIGEPEIFRTFPVTEIGLPDDRAYELVSPPQKNGGEVFPADQGQASCGAECKPPGSSTPGARFPMQATADGGAVVFEGFVFSSTEGAAVLNEYLARRGASGWQTTAISPALQSYGGAQGHVAVDGRLQKGLIFQASPQLSAGAPVGYQNLYAQSTSSPGLLTALLTAVPPNRTALGFTLEYAGHSADFTRLLFAANDALTEATPFAPKPTDPGIGGRDLYEWHAGSLALVNVLPENTAVATEAKFGSISPDSNAISSDGSRVFWSDGTGQVYVREDGETTREVTDHVGHFVTASDDGSRVLLSDGCLYVLAAEDCEDLTDGQGGFEGVAGQTSDLSHVYFVDSAALTPATEENEHGEHAIAGKNNLYDWSAGQPQFVAALLNEDNLTEQADDWVADPARRTAEASPNGRYLAFLSQAELTGHRNVGPACFLNSKGEYVSDRCFEVFLYDSATGRLLCASCNPTGEAPLGRSTLRRIFAAKEWLPQPRYLTDSGRLYFDSADRLSPRDSNEGVEDVYEFEPPGGPQEPSGDTCARPDGCVSLISTGAGTTDANLLAVDETGQNVFFTTRLRLVPRDNDELIDLYDAREFGGFTEDGELEARECSGEACQSEPPALRFPTPGSSGFEGPGNGRASRPCGQKPARRGKGRCSKGKGRKHKKHKKHKPEAHKRGGRR